MLLPRGKADSGVDCTACGAPGARRLMSRVVGRTSSADGSSTAIAGGDPCSGKGLLLHRKIAPWIRRQFGKNVWVICGDNWKVSDDDRDVERLKEMVTRLSHGKAAYVPLYMYALGRRLKMPGEAIKELLEGHPVSHEAGYQLYNADF